MKLLPGVDPLEAITQPTISIPAPSRFPGGLRCALGGIGKQNPMKIESQFLDSVASARVLDWRPTQICKMLCKIGVARSQVVMSATCLWCPFYVHINGIIPSSTSMYVSDSRLSPLLRIPVRVLHLERSVAHPRALFPLLRLLFILLGQERQPDRVQHRQHLRNIVPFQYHRNSRRVRISKRKHAQ